MSLEEKIRYTKDLWERCGVIPYAGGRVEVKVFKCVKRLELPWLATALFIPHKTGASRAPIAMERKSSYTLKEVCRDFEEKLLQSIPEIRGALESSEEYV